MRADHKILTETQERFLNEFFLGGGSTYYLSGGTALAAFYLQHRFSDDLDFFTREEERPEVSTPLVERAAHASGLTLERVASRRVLTQFFLSGDAHPDHPLTKVECLIDTPPYFADPRVLGGVFVDDLLCIGVNKVTTVTERSEPKDYVDLYLIVQQGGLRLEDLIRLAQEKTLRLSDLSIAAGFDKVDELRGIAGFQRKYMLIDVGEADLVAFYKDWAHRIYAQLPPGTRYEGPAQ